MAGEVIEDALPYIDQGYDEPGVREAVSKIIKLDILFDTLNFILFIKTEIKLLTC